MDIIEKTCSKCGDTKPLCDFYKDKSRRDGRRLCCKQCAKAYSRDYHVNNREKRSAREKKWRMENPERVRALKRKWYRENPEKILAIRRKHTKENPEKNRSCKRYAVACLRDPYIKGQIHKQTGLRASEIPESLVQAKRAHLQLVRKLREEKQHGK